MKKSEKIERILNNYKKLYESGEVHRFVFEEVWKKFEESYFYYRGSEMKYEILIDEDEIYINEPVNTNSVYTYYTGNYFASSLATIDAFRTIDCELVTDIDVEELTKEERGRLWKSIMHDSDIRSLVLRYKEDGEKVCLTDILYEEQFIVEEHFKEEFPSKYKTLMNDYIDFLWGNDYREHVLSDISDGIDELCETLESVKKMELESNYE